MIDENIPSRVLDFLKKEPKGAAALAIAKKLEVNVIDVVRALQVLSRDGLVEKKGGTYRLTV